MFKRFMRWKKARVRLFERKNFYIRFTPNFGIGMPWFRNRAKNRPCRLRIAWHHGVQVVEWRGARWVVSKQLLGRSRVIGESMDLERRY